METSFFFYTSYAEWGRAGLTEDQYYMYLAAILYYGTTGTYEINDPAVESLFTQVRYSIDATKKRYEKAKRNGAKGGRPGISGPQMRLYAAQMSCPMVHTDVTQEFLMEEYGCSKRTVQRKCPTDYLEKLDEMRREREENTQIYYHGRSRYKAMGITLYDFIGPSLPDLYQILFLDNLERALCIGLEDVKELTKGRPYTRLRIESYSEGERWANRIEQEILKTGKTPYGDRVEVVRDSDGGRRLKVVAKAGDEMDPAEVTESEVKEDGVTESSLVKDGVEKNEVAKSTKKDADEKKEYLLYALCYAKEGEILLFDSYSDAMRAMMDKRPDNRKMGDSYENIKEWIDSLPPPEGDSTRWYHIVIGKKAPEFQHTWIPSRAFYNRSGM